MRLSDADISYYHALMRTPGHPRRQEALNALLGHYKPLALITAKRVSNRLVESDDLRQEAMLALLHCVKTFDPVQGAFTPYAIGCIRGACLSFIRTQLSKGYMVDARAVFKMSKEPGELPLAARLANRRESFREQDDDVHSMVATGPQVVWDEVQERLPDELWRYVDRLKPPTPTLIRLYYVEGIPHREIGKRYGKGGSWCAMRLKSAYQKLRAMMETP